MKEKIIQKKNCKKENAAGKAKNSAAAELYSFFTVLFYEEKYTGLTMRTVKN